MSDSKASDKHCWGSLRAGQLGWKGWMLYSSKSRVWLVAISQEQEQTGPEVQERDAAAEASLEKIVVNPTAWEGTAYLHQAKGGSQGQQGTEGPEAQGKPHVHATVLQHPCGHHENSCTAYVGD